MRHLATSLHCETCKSKSWQSTSLKSHLKVFYCETFGGLRRGFASVGELLNATHAASLTLFASCNDDGTHQAVIVRIPWGIATIQAKESHSALWT